MFRESQVAAEFCDLSFAFLIGWFRLLLSKNVRRYMHPARTLEDLIEKLPPEGIEELEDYAQFLRGKYFREGQPLTLSWRGALKDLRDKCTSVELQHKLLDEWES